MPTDFESVVWDDRLERDARRLVRLALEEDLGGMPGEGGHDWTTEGLVDRDQAGKARVVARQAGVAAGLGIVSLVADEASADWTWEPCLTDGEALAEGTPLGCLSGQASGILTCERTILNFLGRLCGIATLVQEYVQQVEGTEVLVYDTRKTTPGWRRLEKYAVRCGGGKNHRTGLFDAVMIKDNHLALAQEAGLSPAEAVVRMRSWSEGDLARPRLIEVEVDTLEQLTEVLSAKPDIVLLDNMTCTELEQAVAMRDATNPRVALEASGGVRLTTIGTIAQAGVDRISVGSLTHSAVGLDVGLDWD